MSIGGRVFTTILLLAVLGVFGVAGSRTLLLRGRNSGPETESTAPITLAFAIPAAKGAAVPASIVNSSAAGDLLFEDLPPTGPRWLVAALAGFALFGSLLIRRGKYLHGGGNPFR
jgi:anti-sigma factor RsiW